MEHRVGTSHGGSPPYAITPTVSDARGRKIVQIRISDPEQERDGAVRQAASTSPGNSWSNRCLRLPLPWRAVEEGHYGEQRAKEEDMAALSDSGGTGLTRSLSIWAAVGLSVALMTLTSPPRTSIRRGGATYCRPCGAADLPHRGRRRDARGPTPSSGCASTSITPARSTRSSARRLGPRAGSGRGLGHARHLHVLRGGHRRGRGRHLRHRRSCREIGAWPNPPTLGAVDPGRGGPWRWCCFSPIIPARRGAGHRVWWRAPRSRLFLIVTVAGAGQAAGRERAGAPPLHPRGVHGGDRGPSRTTTCSSAWCSASCRSPDSRRQPPWARKPGARPATSRARSSASRCSAASTSPWSRQSR